MKSRRHATRDEHHRREHLEAPPRRANRLRDRMVLAGLAALTVFVAVYAYVGSTKLFFAFTSAASAGAIVYLFVSSAPQHKG